MASLRPRQLDSGVREALRQKILSGALKNGMHLSELKLSKAFKVSRTPVREALCALAADGLVELIPNRGAFVKAPSDETRLELKDVYAALMGVAARLAGEKATEENLADFNEALAAQQQVAPSEVGKAQQKLNELILRLANNSVFNDAMRIIVRQLPTPLFQPAASVNDRDEVMKNYLFVQAAFKRNKADSAEKILRELMLKTFAC